MSVRVGDELVAGGQGDMYTKAQVDALIASAIAQTTEKPGMIKPFAGTTVPTGYLLCDGSAVSRTTYAGLFAAIGTTYGSGDGSTTFNIPSLSDYALRAVTSSSGVGAKTNGKLPNIVGFTDWWSYGTGSSLPTGAFANALDVQTGKYVSVGNSSGNKFLQLLNFDANRCSALYSDGFDSVRPKSMTLYHIIKY